MVSFLRARKATTWLLILSLLIAGAAYASATACSFVVSGPAREWLLTLLTAGMLFLLPGWALLLLWPGAARLTLTEQAAMSTGLGMVIPPVFILLTGSLGLNLGPLYAWLPALAALPLLRWSYRRGHWRATREGWRADARGAIWWPRAALVIVLVAIIGVRCAAVNGMDVPLWGDSLHHTMIAQLLIDHGGLFRSWEPYAAMQSFTYHFGFHSYVAELVWVTGVATPRAVVLSGQVVNMAALFTLYPLALRLGHTRWVGVAALLLAGLLSSMPMFYVNWGRYTQIAGQAILPVGIYLAWEFLSAPHRSWTLLGLTCLTLAGMVLTHYRIAIFAMCFFPAFVAVHGLRSPWRAWMGRGVLLVAGTSALVAPWMVRVFGGRLVPLMLGTAMASSSDGEATTDTLSAVGDLSTFLPMWIWYVIPLAIFVALWRRAYGALIVALWWALVTVIVNPQWLRMPGSGTLTNFALLIAAYLPASLLIGALVGEPLRRLRQPLALAGITLLVAGLAWWGAGARLKDVNLDATALVASADMRAAQWVKTNTPTDARFLINGFFPNAESVVGSDAGWWLPLIAHRSTTLPPLLYIAEQGPRPDYQEWINAVYATLYSGGVDSQQMRNVLREHGVAYVYLGAKGGRVGYAGSAQPLAPEKLLASPSFRPVYHEGDVWVFQIE